MADEQEAQQEVPETEPVVDAAPATDADSFAAEVEAAAAAKADELKRGFQADYTRKMQEISQLRDELKKEREELKAARQPAQQPLEDILVPGDVDGDPLSGPLKALTMREAMLRKQLADAKQANEELRTQVSSIADLILEDQFERQYAAATADGGYAAGLTLDRDAVREHIAKHGLSREPRTMVREAIKQIAAEQYMERLKQQTQDDKPKRSALPKSSTTAPAKVALTPREELAIAAKKLAQQMGWKSA